MSEIEPLSPTLSPLGGEREKTPSSPNERAWRRFRHNRLAMVSVVFIGVVTALVVIWPLLSAAPVARLLPTGLTHAPNAVSDAQFAAPDAAHWFGTDVHGRDLLSRVCGGARISLMVGIVGTLVSLVIGVLWGAVAGYRGGRVDAIMMRLVDILYSMPTIIFVMVLITALDAFMEKWQSGGAGLSAGAAEWLRLAALFAGLGAVSWLPVARMVRGQVLSLRSRAFVEASRVLGAGDWHILRRHILPNVYGVIIVYMTMTVPSIILYESFLSYLGMGIQPPAASLGSLIASGSGEINPVRIYWWLIVFPAGTLALVLLALNFVGDALRDAWDPREKAG